jgi:hypothetical protein
MTENPYRLARDIRGIGFKTADAIAMKLGIRTRLPAVACRSSARSSGNFGARPPREAGGNAVGHAAAYLQVATTRERTAGWQNDSAGGINK